MVLRFTVLNFLLWLILPGLASYAQNNAAVNVDTTAAARVEQLNTLAFKNRQSDPVTSLSYAELSLEISRKTNYRTGEINALILMGMVYKNIGAVDKAIASYFTALKLADKAGDKRRMSSCLNNIGGVFQVQEDYLKALKYYRLSMKMEEELGDKNQLSIRLYNLGVVYEAIDSLDLAYAYYYNSLLIEEEANNPEGIYYALYGIAGVETKQKRFTSAMANITRALQVAHALDDVLGIAVCYTERGKLYMATGKEAEAISSLDSALYFAESADLMNEMKDAHVNLAGVWNKVGNYQKAYFHLNRYVSINDSLNSIAAKNRVAELEARYEVDRKEEVISNLRENFRLKTEKAASERRNRNFLLLTVILAMLLAVYNLRKIAVDIRKTILLAAGILLFLLLVSLILLWSGIYDYGLNLDDYFRVFADVLTFSVLPIFVLIFLTERFLLNRYLKKAGELTAQIKDMRIPHSDRQINLSFEGKEADLDLSLSDLICFEANDNYTAVYYLKNKKIVKDLYRITLKRIEDQVSGIEEIVRCHKSYIINIDNVSRVSGNAQGYKLHLQMLDFAIPVSRKFPQSMIERIRGLN